MKIVTVAQMRALEEAAFRSGVTEATLQDQAGRAVAEVARELADGPGRIAALVGRGNNGRDAAVAAHYLAESSLAVDLLLAPGHAVRDDELEGLRGLGVEVHAPDAFLPALERASVVLDGLTGIGIRGALREPLAGFARQVNDVRAARDQRVLAIDVPSGVDADTGGVPGEAVRADVTVTLGAVKSGLLCFPAAEYAGRLVGRSLAIPPEDVATLPHSVIETEALGHLLPPRPPGAHKYSFGRVLVVAGSEHFPGAAVLCSGAAARAGAGLVRVAAGEPVREVVAQHFPEVTYAEEPVDLSADPVRLSEVLEPLLGEHDVVLLGPGLGRQPGTIAGVRHLLALRARLAPPEGSLVIDADGLFALQGWDRWWERLGANAVLTPHAGELARLTGDEPDDADPWTRAARLARRWGCVLVAKGPFTIIAQPEGATATWPRANAALATAGTGDVLAGLCAGLLAQRSDLVSAAWLAVGIHALAAERVVALRSWRTLLASDLLPAIPRVMAELT